MEKILMLLFGSGHGVTRIKKGLCPVIDKIVDARDTGVNAPIDSLVRLERAVFEIDLGKIEALIRLLKKRNKKGKLSKRILALESLKLYITELNSKELDINISEPKVEFETVKINGKTALDWLEVYDKDFYKRVRDFVFENAKGIEEKISALN